MSKNSLRIKVASMALLAGSTQTAQTETLEESTELNYRFSQYNEDAIDSDVVFTGDVDRYDISVHQLALRTSALGKYDLRLDVLSETMSGASPWYVAPDVDNNPVQIMSGATIEEARNDVSFSVTRFFDSSRASGTIGVSNENDYSALTAAVGYELDFNNKNTTVGLGLVHSNDEIRPSGTTDYPDRPTRESKSSTAVSLVATQVMSPTTLLSLGASLSQWSGYLSDPYKLAFVVDDTVNDTRPDRKIQKSITLQLREHFPTANASLHLNYQASKNDWDIVSNTIELKWHWDIGDKWTAIPYYRIYQQSDAEFYSLFYLESREDGYYSSDYRLSAFGSQSGGMKLSRHFAQFTVSAKLERYISDGQLFANSDEQSHPGLVNFSLFQLGIDWSI